MKLAPVHPRELERFLLAVGRTFKRQKGSHKVYWRSDLRRPVIIPWHDPVPVFIIKNTLRQLNISAEEYDRVQRSR